MIIYTIANLSNETKEQITVNGEEYQPGKYIVCIYDANLYVGNIKDHSDEHSDVLVSFMKRSKNNVHSWPARSREEKCWEPLQHIICALSEPSAQSRSARNYTMSSSDLN